MGTAPRTDSACHGLIGIPVCEDTFQQFRFDLRDCRIPDDIPEFRPIAFEVKELSRASMRMDVFIAAAPNHPARRTDAFASAFGGYGIQPVATVSSKQATELAADDRRLRIPSSNCLVSNGNGCRQQLDKGARTAFMPPFIAALLSLGWL